MTATVLVKKQADNYYEWWFPGNDAEVAGNGDAESLAAVCPAGTSVVLLAAAELVSLSVQSFDQHEKKVYAKTLPYTLEDALVEDVECQHFAFGEVDHQAVPVAIIRDELIRGWLEELSAEGVEVQELLPELCLVPWQEGNWTLLVDGDRYVLRYGRFAGFSLERDSAMLALQLLANDGEVLPESLLIYADENLRESLSAEVPEILASRLQWAQGSYWPLLAEGYGQFAAVNLLQGDYTRSLPWKSWWQQWRLLASVLAVTLSLQLIFHYIELKSLQQQNLDLRAQIEQSYRSVIPRGKLVEPERQLRRQVNAMKGDHSTGFVALLDKLAALLAAGDFEVQSLNYNEKQSELRLTLLAPSFNEVENLRAKIAELGLSAEMTGSNSVGDKTRARLRIKG